MGQHCPHGQFADKIYTICQFLHYLMKLLLSIKNVSDIQIDYIYM